MSVILFKEQLDQYERDGIIFPVKVFSADEVAFFRGALEAIITPAVQPKRLDNLHLFFDWAHRLVTTQVLLNVIQEVLGDDILIYGTLVFYKPPRDKGYVPASGCSLFRLTSDPFNFSLDSPFTKSCG